VSGTEPNLVLLTDVSELFQLWHQRPDILEDGIMLEAF
jgi:hypothetical protein